MSAISNASSRSSQTDVFICCSPEDNAYLQELKKHFAYDKREHHLAIWDDTSVLPGSMRQQEMEQALRSARAAILLISTDFIASDDIAESVLPQIVTASRQKNITILSVILRPCEFEKIDELAQFQPVNPPSSPLANMKPSERENIWIKVAQQVREIIRGRAETSFERLFGPPETAQAAHYFFQCRYMRNKQSREQILRRLPSSMLREIETFPLVEQDDCNADLAEVSRIVEACSTEPDGLERLAHALYLSERASLSWQALDTYLRKRGRKLVTYTRWQELYEILRPAQWLDHLLNSIYRESVPENWEVLQNFQGPDKLQLILEDLIKIPPQNNDTFPILEFVQRLAFLAWEERRDGTLHDALRAWLVERFSELGLTESQQTALQEKAKTRRQSAIFYLQLLLDAVSEGTFSVQCWLRDSENNMIQNATLEVPDEPYSLKEIPDLLEVLLEQCENCLQDAMKHLVIEFFLPLELLSYPVDQYAIRDFKTLRSISLYHQVVVRSLERARKQNRRYIWRDKWNLLQEKQVLNEHKDMAMIYRAEHYNGSESLSATLLGASVACLALAFVPSDSSSQTNDILSAILQAGVPIALWPREQTNYPKELHELFLELVSHYPLSQLPALVKQQRQEAITSGKQQHQGYHLTLLWDDPNRLPPSAMTPRQLTMPPVRRGA